MEKITLAHGSGGKLMHQLIDSVFLEQFSNKILREKKDSAVFSLGQTRFAFTTDSYVVDPLFFPGGDIGSLAVYGTVNDLSVCGARPRYLACGLIVEEGLDRGIVERIARSIRNAALKAGVEVVTGDIKVVERGHCDKLFISTSGIGIVDRMTDLSLDRVRIGDSVIASGTIGDHAISILSQREGLNLGSRIVSDSAPLNGLTARIVSVSRHVRFMRDPTRGGLAATLNEIVTKRKFGIVIDERALPIRPSVKTACELVGFDPLSLANEGKIVVIVGQQDARRVLSVMRSHRYGTAARVIGKIVPGPAGKVILNTSVGSRRIVEMPSGEQVPRIC